jgi:hypothetical protein
MVVKMIVHPIIETPTDLRPEKIDFCPGLNKYKNFILLSIKLLNFLISKIQQLI